MHPADEFVAMAALIDGGATIDDVAHRFGTSERHVRQRLRLGKLAPELLDAYRAGAISLDAVTAFTLGADHAAQLAVWNQLKDNSYIQPYTVKRLLTESAVPLDSDLGLFVGAEAYEAAGGTITRDLFSGDDDGFMDDAALVRRLAIEKLEAKAAELRPQWAWTKAVLDPEYGFLAQYARVEPQPAEVPAELAAEIERIEQRLGELEDIGGDDFTDELAAEAAQLEERRTEIDEIDRRPRGLSARRTASAPAASSRSAMTANSACIRASSNARRSRGDADAGDADAQTDDDDDDDLSSRPMPTTRITAGLRPSPAPSRRCARNAASARSLVDDLKAHRLQITRAHLAADFEVAFDLALYSLVHRSVRRLPATTRPARFAGDRSRAAQLAERSLRHPGATAARGARSGARSRLAQTAAGRRLRRARGTADRSQAASLRLVHRRHASSRSWRSRTAPIRSSKPPAAASHPVRRLLAADRRQLLGPRQESARPRDRPRNPRRSLGARSRRRQKAGARGGARNRLRSSKSSACIGLDQAARDSAAAWLPPGMAYDDAAAVVRRCQRRRPGPDAGDIEPATPTSRQPTSRPF